MGLPGLALEARPDRLRLSRPVLVGYMAGVALIMIAGQLSRISGVPISGGGFLAQVLSFACGIGGIQLATAAVVAFGLRQRGVSVAGPLPTGAAGPGTARSSRG
jgi:MFS superfamily sulfate permease-like transporter